MARAQFRGSNTNHGKTISYDPSQDGLVLGERFGNALPAKGSNVDLSNNQTITKDVRPDNPPRRRKRDIPGGNTVFGVYRVLDEGGKPNLICPSFSCDGSCFGVGSGGDDYDTCVAGCGDNPDESIECMRKIAYYFGPPSMIGPNGLPFPWDIDGACGQPFLFGDPWVIEPPSFGIGTPHLPLQGTGTINSDIYNNPYRGPIPRIPLGYSSDTPGFTSLYFSSLNPGGFSDVESKINILYPLFDEPGFIDGTCFPRAGSQFPPVSPIPADALDFDTFMTFAGVETCPDTGQPIGGRAYAITPRTYWQGRFYDGNLKDLFGNEIIPDSVWGFVSIVYPCEDSPPAINTSITDLFDYTAAQFFWSAPPEEGGDCPAGNFWDEPATGGEDSDGYKYYFFSSELSAPIPYPQDFNEEEVVGTYCSPTLPLTVGQVITRGGQEEIMMEDVSCRIITNEAEDNEGTPFLDNAALTSKDRPATFQGLDEISWLAFLTTDYSDASDLIMDKGECYVDYVNSGGVQAIPELNDDTGELEFGTVYLPTPTNTDSSGKTLQELIIDGDNIIQLNLPGEPNVVQSADGTTCDADDVEIFPTDFKAVAGVADTIPAGIDVEEEEEFSFLCIGVIVQ